MLSLILQRLIAKHFRFVLLTVHVIPLPHARFHGCRLKMNLTEDDMPLAEDAAG